MAKEQPSHSCIFDPCPFKHFSPVANFGQQCYLKKDINKLFDPRTWEICLGTKNLERYLTQALREDVYEIVPFIFGLANETFEAQKISKLSVLPGRGSDGSNFTPETALNNLQKEGKSQF